MVAVADFPDDETGTAFLLALGGQGNVRTTTLRAFTADQLGEIMNKLP
ncbi:GYD domain-containing protein [Phytohabitans rumicis]